MSKQVFELIKELNIDASIFYKVLNTPDMKKYKKFYIGKRSGGKRLIEAPIDKDLKKIQERLLHYVFEPEYNKYKPNIVHSYTKNKSIITNAKSHFDKKPEYILKIDLIDFFNSITYERLFGLFKRIYSNNSLLGYSLNRSKINALCLLVTCDKHLPQGACTSPILSNMICKRMDEEILKYCKTRNVTYTRYADDMTFSFTSYNDMISFLQLSTIGSKEMILNDDFVKIIESNGFRINKKKIRLLNKSRSQKITGIVINEKINVRRKYIRNLRAAIHKVEKENGPNTKELIGKVNFLRQVRGLDDELANKYAVRLNKLGVPPFPDANFRLSIKNALDYYLIKIELPDGSIGTGFISKGFLITSKHVLEITPTENYINQKCKRGFYPYITLVYFDPFDLTSKSTTTNIKECFVYNEIAFAKIDCIDIFKNKTLKIIDSFDSIDANTKAMACGFKDTSGKVILFNDTSILTKGCFFNTNCIMCEPGKIFKGMSGGPLIDLDTYKVVGVNFTGPDSSNSNIDSSSCLASIITKNTYKIAEKWVADDFAKHSDVEIIEEYRKQNN